MEVRADHVAELFEANKATAWRALMNETLPQATTGTREQVAEWVGTAYALGQTAERAAIHQTQRQVGVQAWQQFRDSRSGSMSGRRGRSRKRPGSVPRGRRRALANARPDSLSFLPV